MSNTIQIKRSTGTNTPSSLSAGELGYSEASDKLFIGLSGGSVQPIAGQGAFLRSDTNDTFSGNLIVTGNLTVNGSTTTVSSNTVSVGDNIIVLNSDETGTPSQNAGIEIERGTADNAILQFNESDDGFEALIGSSSAPFKASNLTLTGNATVTGTTDLNGNTTVDAATISIDATSTLNIDNSNTSNGITIGTATSGVPISIGHTTSETTINDNATVTGNLGVTGSITGSSTVQGTTITATTAFVPDANDGAVLGTSSLGFSDLFFADGAIIKFGNDQDVLLTHVHNTGLLLGTNRQLQFRDSALKILSSADGQLDIDADTEVEITTPLVEISADATVGDDLTLKSDASVLGFGADTEVTLTHVHNTGLILNSTNQLQFGDSATYIHQSADGVLDLVSDSEIEINATTVDINGNADVSGTFTVAGAFTSLGIDDNCSAERLQLADSTIEIMASGVTLSGYASGTSTLDKFVIDGGTF